MERVVTYISDQIRDHLEDLLYLNFFEWLNKLKDGGPSDQRLLCCIGIDIKYNLVNLDVLVEIFNSIDYFEALKSPKPSHFFETTLRNNQDLHVLGLEYNDDNIFNEIFVRILTLDTFNSYFYNRIEGVGDVKLANDNLLEEIKRGQLEEVKMPNDGPPFRKIAWITPRSVIQGIIDKCKVDGSNTCNIVTNCLGLIIDPKSCEYLVIEYPADFSEKTYQPCTLNANWYDTDENPGLFISNKKLDKYGRTRTRTVDDEEKRLKERIHKPLPIGHVYCVKYLEKADDFVFSVNKIGQEALLRFL